MLSVHVLGPVEVRRDGVPVDLGGPQQRAVVAHLALDAGRVVSIERLIDRLWGDEPPRTPLGTLQSYVSRLRKAIEPPRAPGSAPQVLVSEAPGYVLRVDPADIDVHEFTRLVGQARTAAAAGQFAIAVARFDEALALWRGPALAGVGPEDEVRSIVVRLDEERSAAIEDRFEALLALGRHVEVVPAVQAAVDEYPLRERLWSQLAIGLYRSGRQADALRALSTARERLLDELGIDPGPELRQLETRILSQDPALAVTPDRAAVAAPVSAPVAVPRVELIGRDREWERLTAAVGEVERSGARLVLIEGEPGIGKSTLSDGVIAHTRQLGWQVATGRCVEQGLAPSLWPCIEIVRDVLENHPAAAAQAPGTERLRQAVAVGQRASVAISPVELASEFIALIDASAGRPWLFVLDDLHWADRATLEVVTLVLERLGGNRVLVLGAYRPPEIVPGSLLAPVIGEWTRSIATTRVAVSPLDADGVRRLMELTTGAVPAPDVADRVQHRAGGNPLFVAELARLAGERGLAEDAVVPEAIRDVVRSRLAQLPDAATIELQVAATLGERFDLRTVMAASDRTPDECLDALDAAIVTRILVPDGDRFRFTHALVRDAVLSELTPLRRARLHQRAAEAIIATRGTGPDEAEPIAFHRLGSVTISDPLVVAGALVRASDVARWRNALETADRLAAQALDVLEGVARSPELDHVEVEALEALAGTAFRRGHQAVREMAVTMATLAARSGSDAAQSLALFMEWGDIDETHDLETVRASTERARHLVTTTTSPYASVTCNYMLGSFALMTGRVSEAVRLLETAVGASGTTDPDQRPRQVPLVVAPVVAGIAAAVSGDVETARTHAHRRVRAWLSQRIEVDSTALSAVAFAAGSVEALIGDAPGVLAVLDGVDRVDVGGFMALQGDNCDVLYHWARAMQGDPLSAQAAGEAIVRIEADGEQGMRSCMRTFAAEAFLAHGDQRAVELLAHARHEAEARGELWWMPETLRLMAVADRRFGDGSAAAALLDDARALSVANGSRLLTDRIAAMSDGR